MRVIAVLARWAALIASCAPVSPDSGSATRDPAEGGQFNSPKIRLQISVGLVSVNRKCFGLRTNSPTTSGNALIIVYFIVFYQYAAALPLRPLLPFADGLDHADGVKAGPIVIGCRRLLRKF